MPTKKKDSSPSVEDVSDAENSEDSPTGIDESIKQILITYTPTEEGALTLDITPINASKYELPVLLKYAQRFVRAALNVEDL